MLQAAGYQAILHGHAGGYLSHILAGGRWTVWHGTPRQGAFPPHVNWQQEPTQACYVTADPSPLAVLLHTISAPNIRQEPRWDNPPTLIWSPDQEEHLRAAWQGDAIRTMDVPDLHAGPITHARPAATLAVAQRGQQNPQRVACMFSPGDAHIAVCDPERLPGPEAVIRVTDCAPVIVKALQKANTTPFCCKSALRTTPRRRRQGCGRQRRAPPTWSSSWRSQPRYTTGSSPSTTCGGEASPTAKWASHTGKSGCTRTRSATPSRVLDPRQATRALDTSAPGRALAPHTVPLATLPFDLAPEGTIRKSVALPPARWPWNQRNAPYVRSSTTQGGDAGTPGVARGACRRPSGRQGGGLPHPPGGGGTEMPVARPCTPSAPPPKRAATQRPRGRKGRHPKRPGEPTVQPTVDPSPRDWPPWPPSGPPSERAPHTRRPRHTPGT